MLRGCVGATSYGDCGSGFAGGGTVSVGGGSGAAGTCITAKSINPAIRVIGAQSAQSPAGYESWRGRRVTTAANHTFAEGLATGCGLQLLVREIENESKISGGSHA